MADGTLPGVPGQSGEDGFGFTKAFHWTHEAGIQYLQRLTSFKSDHDIKMLRQSFLSLLLNDFGIQAVGDPANYFDMPVVNQIDLGGGNTVVPYVVNELANMRILARADFKSGDNASKTMRQFIITYP